MPQENSKEISQELTKVPQLIDNLNVVLLEVQKNQDKDRVKRILPWLEIQIQSVRILGGDTTQLLGIKNQFQSFLSLQGRETIESETLGKILKELDWRNIENLDMNKLDQYFKILKLAVEKGSVRMEEITSKIIPKKEYSLNLFYSDNYRKSFSEKINKLQNRNDNYAQATLAILTCCNDIKKNQLRHHAVFKVFTRTFGEDIDFFKKSYLFPSGAKEIIPSSKDLSSNHQNALDIFFPIIIENGKEKGPDILSLSAGVVLAVADDWQGGQTEESYVKGGLSPISGNGVLIFNPETNQYFYYLHFHSIKVKLGDIVESCDVLGKGGNSGINASKNGHGKHLHFEMHDFNPVFMANNAKVVSELVREILAAK